MDSVKSNSVTYSKVNYWKQPDAGMEEKQNKILLEEIISRLKVIEERLIRVEKAFHIDQTPGPGEKTE
ncbi:MAG: hypothetical protein K9L17_09120 [Clostridiales bacterium]|nr:hypothetical protein [Clostridiales bacterium]MCF8022838.1 hypothetical protein [Clostridiales bacterium]